MTGVFALGVVVVVCALDWNLALSSEVGVLLVLVPAERVLLEEEAGEEDERAEREYVPSLIPGPAELADTNP